MALTSERAARMRTAIALSTGVAAMAGLFAWRVVATSRERLGDLARLVEDRYGYFSIELVIGAFALTMAATLTAQWLAVSPLAGLTRTLKSMQRDLRIRSRVRGEDEIGQLGEAIDALAAVQGDEKASLEEDRDRLIAILESMAEGVLVTGRGNGRDGVVVLANAALRSMLLLERSIVGRPPMEAIRVAGLDEVLARAASTAPGEATIDRPTGDGATGELEIGGMRPRRVLVRAAPIRRKGKRGDPSGNEAVGLVAVFNDVTELRRLEAVRRDFVANVSHELRTPIAAISNAAETLLAGALSDAQAAADFTGIISRHAVRLKNLVDDLLELSKIEAKEWRLAIEPVDVRGAALAALDAVRPNASSRNAEVRDLVPDDLPPIAVDRRAVDQVLVNLLDNAIKYAGSRGPIELAAKRDGNTIVFSVKDRGAGIEPRHLPRLFERFYRVDPGRSRAVGGTGLGLSIVKHLVEAMSGRIEVQSSVGVGTTFFVHLRIASDELIAKAAAEAPSERIALG
jgi:two-component system phosphate regulon sensor histidine kinase PhoR